MNPEKKILNVAKELMKIWVRFATNVSIRKRHERIFSSNPKFKQGFDKQKEKEHIQIWKQIRSDICLDTYRICSNLSGNPDPEYIPEEVFASDVQRCLCKRQEKIQYITNKSFYEKWISQDVFPMCYLHNIEGTYYDSEYNKISVQGVLKLVKQIQYPVIIKPNMDSMGGKDVYFINRYEELKNKLKNNENFVIQKIIKPHKFFKRFNDHGLNTIRIDLYRSVKDNQIHFLNASLRMGMKGSLDNETAGGIHCRINENGFLQEYAVDKYGNKYLSHPDSQILFSGQPRIPYYEEMVKLSIAVGSEMYLMRLISLDLALDDHNNWKIIEINAHDLTIRFSQYGGKPFFGELTEEVISYCNSHPWWK